MHADIKGALAQINTSWKGFEHRGKFMTKSQVKSVLEYAIEKGYETTAELTDEEVDKVLGWHICYKSNQICKYDCKGLCKESC